MEQSREMSSTLPLHLGVVAIEKEAFGSPSTTVSQLTTNIYIYIYILLVTLVEVDSKLLHRGIEECATLFLGLLHFTLDPHLIVLSAKQGDIKYHFLNLWFDSTWDWTSVSQNIGEYSTH